MSLLTKKAYKRDHTATYLRLRDSYLETKNLDRARLEKRITLLTKSLSNTNKTQGTFTPWFQGFAGSSQVRKLQQQVAPWEDDVNVMNCPYCHQVFTAYNFRKHHCRTCGKVVCGDLGTNCSIEELFDVQIRKYRPIQFLSRITLKHIQQKLGTNQGIQPR